MLQAVASFVTFSCMNNFHFDGEKLKSVTYLVRFEVLTASVWLWCSESDRWVLTFQRILMPST